MGNIGTTIKRFLSNKNTVTLLAIIVGTVILYFFYNNRVNNAVSTTYVCYATQTIPARTKITNEMVSTVKVLTSQISDNMYQNCEEVVGKYASYATEIPENSYFYNVAVMNEDDMPDSVYEGIEDGYTVFNLPVSLATTLGNSIFPGDYIDLFITTEDDNDLPIYGKFIQSIKVLAVKDEEGRNVFETTVESREPSQMLFAVPDDLFVLLRRAQIIGMEIEAVPRNNNYTAEPGTTMIASNALRELIINRSGTISDECILQETPTAECNNNISTDNPNENNDETSVEE